VEVLADETGFVVEDFVALCAGQEELVASDHGADVLQLVDQANAKLLAALRVVDYDILDMSSLERAK
jgi:hypothetical protein